MDDTSNIPADDHAHAEFTPPPPPSDFHSGFDSPPHAEPVPVPHHEDPVPTAPMPSVVLSTEAEVAKHPKAKRGRALPWVLTALFVVAAAVFAFLWVGKSGDADDLTKERDGLNGQVDQLQADLAAANTSLDEANAAAEEKDAENTDLQDQIAELQAQIDTLETQIESAEAAGGSAVNFAPQTSLKLGQSVGQKASPPLTDEEATCLGGSIIDRVGMDFLFEVWFGESEPTDAQLERLGVAGLRAADECGISDARLGF